MKRNNAANYLLMLLTAAAAIILYPTLATVGLTSDEELIREVSRQFASTGISQVFEFGEYDLPTNLYAYLAAVCNTLIPSGDIFSLRLPSATFILLLTLGVFYFRSDERLSNTFLASLLFISSYLVSSLAYRATPVSLMALFFIFALAALYRWIKYPSSKNTYLLLAASVGATTIIGFIAPIALSLLGILFTVFRGEAGMKTWLKLLSITGISVVLTYIGVVFLTNNSAIAQEVLSSDRVFMPLVQYSSIENFARQVFFSIFPWSIPIAISLFWMACNPSWVRNRYLSLSMYKQFGIALFLITIPALFAFNGLSLLLLLSAIFFNMPIISSFLLSQFHNHSVTWRITGGIFAGIISLVAILFIAAQCGLKIRLSNYSYTAPGEWSVWSILLLLSIAASVYSLSRQQRTIQHNNRYIYNIVILYILAQLLYKANINPYLTTTL